MPYADPEIKKKYDRDYGNARREKRAERSKEWRKKNKDRIREHQRRHHLKTKFGITLEEYNELLEKQSGVCAICGTSDTSPWDFFCIDHCHNTGKIRGLLCRWCNTCIGQAKDNPDILRSAIDYLEAHFVI